VLTHTKAQAVREMVELVLQMLLATPAVLLEYAHAMVRAPRKNFADPQIHLQLFCRGAVRQRSDCDECLDKEVLSQKLAQAGHEKVEVAALPFRV